MDAILIVFLIGAIFGYIIEVMFRGYNLKKLCNPGLLYGPYLPIYGFAAVILYLLSYSDINLILKIVIIMTIPTILEFIAGIIFVKYYKLDLWDYSKWKHHYVGIICLKISILWAFLALFAYYLISKYGFIIWGIAKYNWVKYAAALIYLIIIVDVIITFKNKIFISNFKKRFIKQG